MVVIQITQPDAKYLLKLLSICRTDTMVMYCDKAGGWETLKVIFPRITMAARSWIPCSSLGHLHLTVYVEELRHILERVIHEQGPMIDFCFVFDTHQYCVRSMSVSSWLPFIPGESLSNGYYHGLKIIEETSTFVATISLKDIIEGTRDAYNHHEGILTLSGIVNQPIYINGHAVAGRIMTCMQLRLNSEDVLHWLLSMDQSENSLVEIFLSHGGNDPEYRLGAVNFVTEKLSLFMTQIETPHSSTESEILFNMDKLAI